ncbi:DNA (cytosine-5-)-methyltransferase [Klebsiella michiganensis]|uniref:DNA (cytosine-5-)-methyltransferase n=1 Tax=Klebsiella michiganensis TaxID=1134687 RepID=UPI002AF6B8F9|nr:DNA (cytosine-5-)-methyltransferase [Klebsiella michiganensis]MBZ7626090.1 DNA (cytosine-5-)-methyltransferase [Klebsiella michiganensis]
MFNINKLDSDPVMTCEDTYQKRLQEQLDLVNSLLEIYNQKDIALTLRTSSKKDWSRESLNRWLNGKYGQKLLCASEIESLKSMLPKPPYFHGHYDFKFIDLFAGIGGIRSGFESIGGKCVFTSEWNKHAVRTYRANWYCDPNDHIFNHDIREITLSNNNEADEEQAYSHIEKSIPEHDVLLAGFPCQPFSLAGVSKKNSLGKKHGFECDTQGTLFFDIARILHVKKPAIFVLENVKNLKSHDHGKTFSIILKTLKDLGYEISDEHFDNDKDPKIIDGKNFLPQHRERIVIIGFRKDLNVSRNFTLANIHKYFPTKQIEFKNLLDPEPNPKYILSKSLWKYLYSYAEKHRAKGNGFGFGLVDPNNPFSFARALSARYFKDGSEILIDRGWDKKLGELDFDNAENMEKRPRRLSPRECARIMGFEQPFEEKFKIPVSDTQAYRQFGNSVIVPMFAAVAKMLRPLILKSVKK